MCRQDWIRRPVFRKIQQGWAEVRAAQADALRKAEGERRRRAEFFACTVEAGSRTNGAGNDFEMDKFFQ